MCTLLMDCGLSCLSWWVGLVFNVHFSGDTDCGLSCFSWWVGLVLMCTLLVTQTVAVLFQDVSWPGFNVHSSGDTDCGLSCFRMWVGLIFNMHSYGDRGCGLSYFRMWVVLICSVPSSGDTGCDLSCFRWWVFIVLSCGNIYFGASFLGGELLCFWSSITLVTHHLSLLFVACKSCFSLYIFLVTYFWYFLFRRWVAFLSQSILLTYFLHSFYFYF